MSVGDTNPTFVYQIDGFLCFLFSQRLFWATLHVLLAI